MRYFNKKEYMKQYMKEYRAKKKLQKETQNQVLKTDLVISHFSLLIAYIWDSKMPKEIKTRITDTILKHLENRGNICIENELDSLTDSNVGQKIQIKFIDPIEEEKSLTLDIVRQKDNQKEEMAKLSLENSLTLDSVRLLNNEKEENHSINPEESLTQSNDKSLTQSNVRQELKEKEKEKFSPLYPLSKEKEKENNKNIIKNLKDSYEFLEKEEIKVPNGTLAQTPKAFEQSFAEGDFLSSEEINSTKREKETSPSQIQGESFQEAKTGEFLSNRYEEPEEVSLQTENRLETSFNLEESIASNPVLADEENSGFLKMEEGHETIYNEEGGDIVEEELKYRLPYQESMSAYDGGGKEEEDRFIIDEEEEQEILESIIAEVEEKDEEKVKRHEKKIKEIREEKKRIPYEKIVNLYHEVLPNHPEVKVLNTKRKVLIKNNYLQITSNLEDWRKVFEKVRDSLWLSGTNPRGWVANFDWILEHFLDILEGKYDERIEIPDKYRPLLKVPFEALRAIMDDPPGQAKRMIKDNDGYFSPVKDKAVKQIRKVLDEIEDWTIEEAWEALRKIYEKKKKLLGF